VYLFFGQSWPNSDRSTIVGWLTVWTRWLWPGIVIVLIGALARRRYRGIAHLLPVCALGSMGLLLLQSEGVMEARFREPLDPLLLASVVLICVPLRRRQPFPLAA
jgi:CHASE2 domain-containing sensor protein